MSPTRPRKPCPRPGCPALIPAGERFCPAHQRAEYQRQDQNRGTASERGYDAAWRQLRARFLRSHPICDECTEPATEADHILPVAAYPELRLVESNLRPKCKSHHSARTAREQAFGRVRRVPIAGSNSFRPPGP